jgi:hypothetical protein
MHMQKGFGFYSPHETTVLFMKAALISIWIGLDLVVLLTVLGLPRSVLERHAVMLVVVATILVAGTVFSLLFAWVTGSLFARPATTARSGFAAQACHALKGKPYHLIGAGIVVVPIVLFMIAFVASGRPSARYVDAPVSRANLAVANKCAEVASMEQSLFRSDERVVMTQCMLQYDKTYAALRSD